MGNKGFQRGGNDESWRIRTNKEVEDVYQNPDFMRHGKSGGRDEGWVMDIE